VPQSYHSQTQIQPVSTGLSRIAFGSASHFPLCHAADRSSLLPVVTPETPRLPGGAFLGKPSYEILPRVTRRRGLIASGVAALVLLLAMFPAEERMQDTGGPGMVPFELTGGQDRADEILSEWGEGGQDAARESLWIDFGFLLAYGVFLTLALAAVRDLASERGWRRLAAIGGVVLSFGALVAAFDALENACLLLTLEGAGAAFPLLATIFAACKFILLTTAIAYLLAGLTMRLRGRGPAARTS